MLLCRASYFPTRVSFRYPITFGAPCHGLGPLACGDQYRLQEQVCQKALQKEGQLGEKLRFQDVGPGER